MRALLHTPHPAQSGEAADEIRHARAWLLPAGALAVHVADAAVTGGNGLSAIRVRQSRAGDPRGLPNQRDLVADRRVGGALYSSTSRAGSAHARRPHLLAMPNQDRTDSGITALLHAHAAGDGAALGQLLPRVYGELRRIARHRLRRERPGHTLAATELVHEAFLKLVPVERVDWRNRAHFFAIASRAMRNVLIDHAVRRGAVKRGAGAPVLSIGEADATTQQPLDDLIALSEALGRLERLDARQAQVVECRFFGGLSLDETAEALNTSPATVSRDWTFARAWLHHELTAASASASDSASTD